MEVSENQINAENLCNIVHKLDVCLNELKILYKDAEMKKEITYIDFVDSLQACVDAKSLLLTEIGKYFLKEWEKEDPFASAE